MATNHLLHPIHPLRMVCPDVESNPSTLLGIHDRPPLGHRIHSLGNRLQLRWPDGLSLLPRRRRSRIRSQAPLPPQLLPH